MFSVSPKAGYQTVELLYIFMLKIHRKSVREHGKEEKLVVGVKVERTKIE